MTKRALCIGLNYAGTEHELYGCINDVDHIVELLSAHGYECVTLTDSKTTPSDRQPTCENILRWLVKLVEATGEKDTLFVHFSGHGTWKYSASEDDHRDELICAIDGVIVDDVLAKVVKPIKGKCFMLFDCCHSGTIVDIPISYDKKEIVGGKEWDCHIVMMSGCRDPQYSADAWIAGKRQGALTWSFLSCVLACKTWGELWSKCSQLLKKSHYTQQPLLSYTKKGKHDESIWLFKA